MHQMKMAASNLAVAACLLLAAGASVRQANSQPASLDYQFFKDKVQAVFLHKREGHTRCVACHTVNKRYDDALGAAIARRHDLE